MRGGLTTDGSWTSSQSSLCTFLSRNSSDCKSCPESLCVWSWKALSKWRTLKEFAVAHLHSLSQHADKSGRERLTLLCRSALSVAAIRKPSKSLRLHLVALVRLSNALDSRPCTQSHCTEHLTGSVGYLQEQGQLFFHGLLQRIAPKTLQHVFP
eukprot:326604-Amphidinium_carterae.1